jgi:adenosylcobinamide-GDP ribazoletransferase
MMRYELELFFNALRYFTRLPVPAWVGWSADIMNACARWFPAVGLLVGAAAAATLWVAGHFLPSALAVVLSTAVTMRLTGGFHEDGWADVCDGFGGGWTRDQILTIMKDSRIGAYGAMGLVLMLAAKLAALSSMTLASALLALLVAHPLSRLCATVLIYTMHYARDDDPDGTSRAKPLAVKLSGGGMAWAALWGLAPLALLAPAQIVAVIALSVFVTYAAARHFQRRIGGYTGDCLGATQQLAEVAVYIALCMRAG